MTSVFLSYAREDIEFVRRLHDALARLGHMPAWDQDHGVVPFSSLYRDEIIAAVTAAEKFAFVISPDALESGPCADELAAALAANKQVIPILRRPSVPDQVIPPALADRNWIFFDDDEQFERGLSEFSEVLSTDLEWVRLHTWILTRARQWSEEGSDRGALLRGTDLRKAEAWLAGSDTHPETPPTGAQRQYVAASRRASDRFTRNLRTALAGGLAVSLALAAFAFTQRSAAISEKNQAIQQLHAAISNEVTAETSSLDTTDPSLAAELNLAAYRIDPTTTLQVRLLASENIPLAAVLPGLRAGPGATKPANDIAFSRQRHLLAAATSHGTVVLWDAAGSQLPRQLGSVRLGTGSVDSVAFSLDGELLAAQSAAGQIGLWSLADPAHPAAVGILATRSQHDYGLAFSPDGQLLAANTDSSISLWDVRDATHPIALKPLSAPPGASVSAFAFSARGRLLAVAYTSGITLFSLADPARPVPLHSLGIGAKDLPTAVAFGAGGALLTVGSYSGQLNSWLLRNPAQPQALPSATAGNSAVNCLGFSPDGRTLAVGSDDGTLSLWDASFTTGPSLFTSAEAAGTEGLTAVAYSPDGSVIATSDADGTARIWTPPPTLLRPSPLLVQDISVSPDQRTVAVADEPYVWLVSDADKARPIVVGSRLSVPGQQIRWAALSPAGHLLAAGTNTGSIRLWNVTDPARPVVLDTLVTGLSAVDSVTFSSDGRTMAAGEVTNTATFNWYWAARIWDVSHPASPRLLDATSGSTQSIGDWIAQFSPYGRTVAFVTNGDPSLRLWSLANLRHPAPIGATQSGSLAATSITFSPNGSLLAVGNIDSTARIWRTAAQSRPALITTLQAGAEPFDSIALARGGQMVAIGDNGGTLWLWNLPAGTSASRTGQPLQSMPTGGAIFGMAAAGDQLITGNESGEVEFWNLSADAAISRICATTGNELTANVWQRYIGQLPYSPPCGKAGSAP
jgi:WD40 repeat protein